MNVETLNVLLEVIVDCRRRYALYYLIENPITDVETLLDYVVAQEADEWTEPNVREELLHLKITFHHTHLPKLEDAGLIEYDKRTNTVQYRTLSPVLDAFLYITQQIDRPT